MNLVTLLEDRARDDGDRPALVEGVGRKRNSLSFAPLRDRVASSASSFIKSGLEKGDRVLFLHPVSIDLYVALLATMRIGAVPLLVDPGAGLKGLKQAMRTVRPEAWTGHGKGLLAAALLPSLWNRKRLRTSGRHETVPASNPPATVEPSTPALITFTSGSTGRPKAAVRSHGFLLAQNRTLGRAIDLVPGEVDLVTLPVFALANLAHGVTSVLAASGGEPAREALHVGEQLRTEGVTRCAAAPGFFARTIERGTDWKGCRKLFTGGGPVFPSLLDRIEKAAPSSRVCAVYGSTEAEPIAHVGLTDFGEPERDHMRSGGGLLAGHPVEEIDLAIVPGRWGEPIRPLDGIAFSSLCTPPGETGEIVVAGDHVLSGYLDGIGDEETKFRVDERVWHRTGDEGYRDEAGRLWLLGRSGAVIHRDGRPAVYPFAIETALSFHESIARSAVIGIGGEIILAVEWRKDPQPDERAQVESMGGEHGIDRILEFDHIPVDRRHRSKILYPELERLVRARSTSR